MNIGASPVIMEASGYQVVADNAPVAATTEEERLHQALDEQSPVQKTIKMKAETPEFREALVPPKHPVSSGAVRVQGMVTLSRGDSNHSTITAAHPQEGRPSIIKKEEEEAKVSLEPASRYSSQSSTLSSSASSADGSSGQFLVKRVSSRSTGWIRSLQRELYRRADEEATLLETYHRSRNSLPSSSSRYAAATRNEFVLISGPSGVGKSRLAHTLQPVVNRDGGCFVTAKFDQVQRPTPYAALTMAFTQYAEQLMQQGEHIVAQRRRAIREELSACDLGFLTSLVPALERIVGKPERDFRAALTCQAFKRLLSSLGRFLGVVCAPEHPFVFLLDDLQWADPCSMILMSKFVTEYWTPGLTVIGTYQDDDGSKHLECGVSCSHAFKTLGIMEEQCDVTIISIPLKSKPREEIQRSVNDTLRLPQDRADALANIVCKQTHGNAFYVIEFLRWLYEEKLLRYDDATDSWNADDNEIAMSIDRHDRVGDFLVDRLEQLSPGLQEAIKVAASFGSKVDEKLLSVIIPSKSLPLGLQEAARRGILSFDPASGYSFRHDGIQNAAIRLVKPEDKEKFHFRLGRKLWQGLSESDRDKHIFLILSQLNLGRTQIDDAEKEKVAMLCLQGAKQATKSLGFRSASIYLNFGLDLLGEDPWRRQYGLTLALHNATAEIEMTTGSFDRAGELVQAVFDNVRNFRDKIQAYSTFIYLQGVTDRQQDSIDTGVEVLKQLGVKFPTSMCIYSLKKEMRSIKGLLGSKSDAQLMRMPIMEDEDKLAAMQILNLMFLNSLLVRPKFHPFIALKLMKITLRHGLSALSSVAFAGYGMLCASLGDLDRAFRFGDLSLKLLDRFQIKEYLPRVYAAVYGCIYPWKRPLAETLHPLMKAHSVGAETGDFEFAFLNSSVYCAHMFYSGSSLPAIEREMADFSKMTAAKKQHSLHVLLKPFYQLTHNLMGLTEDPLVLSGEIMDDLSATEHAESTRNPSSLLCIRSQKMMLGYMFADWDMAAKMNEELGELANPPPGMDAIFAVFFRGLTNLALARRSSGRARTKRMSSAKQHIQSLKKWSQSSPHNCLAMSFLLQAEYASVSGKKAEAYEKFVCAVGMANDSGFSMVKALASECAARHLFALEDYHSAAKYFKKACAYYQEWGAKAKLNHLEAEVKELFQANCHECFTFES